MATMDTIELPDPADHVGSTLTAVGGPEGSRLAGANTGPSELASGDCAVFTAEKNHGKAAWVHVEGIDKDYCRRNNIGSAMA